MRMWGFDWNGQEDIEIDTYLYCCMDLVRLLASYCHVYYIVSTRLVLLWMEDVGRIRTWDLNST